MCRPDQSAPIQEKDAFYENLITITDGCPLRRIFLLGALQCTSWKYQNWLNTIGIQFSLPHVNSNGDSYYRFIKAEVSKLRTHIFNINWYMVITWTNAINKSVTDFFLSYLRHLWNLWFMCEFFVLWCIYSIIQTTTTRRINPHTFI